MKPSEYNFEVWRGANDALLLKFKDAAGAYLTTALDGSTFILRVVDSKGFQQYRYEAVSVNGLLTFPFLPTDTRKIPEGISYRYEVERRIAAIQEVWLFGTITGRGGVNDD